MMELKRRHMNVLRTLAEQPEKPFLNGEIPDGNGRYGMVSGATLRDLRHVGLIMFSQYYGHRITEDGLKIVQEKS